MATSKPETAKSVTLTFEKEKETKNSVKYQEKPTSGQAPVIGSLYVQKWFVGTAQTIELTLAVK